MTVAILPDRKCLKSAILRKNDKGYYCSFNLKLLNTAKDECTRHFPLDRRIEEEQQEIKYWNLKIKNTHYVIKILLDLI